MVKAVLTKYSMVLPPIFLLHDRPADMNTFGGAFAKAVNPQNFFGFAVEENFLACRRSCRRFALALMLKLRAAHFVRHFHIAVNCCSVLPTELISGMV